MTKLCTVIIRVDANPRIGIGHLKRCMTLARQLHLNGFNVRLVGRYRFGKKIEQLTEKYCISWLEDTEIGIGQRDALENESLDAEATLSIIEKHPNCVSCVIVDNYALNEQWERIIREAGHGVVVIDDYRDRRHFADILVSDSETPFDPAFNGCGDKPRELVGSAYALVDPEFAFIINTSSSAGRQKRILISYGGSDQTGETSKALEAVHLLRHDEQCREQIGSVDVVVGHGNARADDVTRLARGMECVSIHNAPDSLAILMRNTDLLFTAGGNTVVEGLAMRKPCLVTLTSDNQALMVAQLLEQRAIISLGNCTMVGSLDVAKAMSNIFSEYEQFASGIRARHIFDHFGAHRIVEAIQSMQKDRAIHCNHS